MEWDRVVVAFAFFFFVALSVSHSHRTRLLFLISLVCLILSTEMDVKSQLEKQKVWWERGTHMLERMFISRDCRMNAYFTSLLVASAEHELESYKPRSFSPCLF
jgi:hypothetical protein